jgi:hypothetical protein
MRSIKKATGVYQPQFIQVQWSELDDEVCPLDLSLHKVNVGYSNRVIKARCHLMSNSMMSGVVDKEELYL